jgi:hypothetical protein
LSTKVPRLIYIFLIDITVALSKFSSGIYDRKAYLEKNRSVEKNLDATHKPTGFSKTKRSIDFSE